MRKMRSRYASCGTRKRSTTTMAASSSSSSQLQLLLFVGILFGLILLVQSTGTSTSTTGTSSTSTSSTTSTTTRSLPRSHNGRTTSISSSSSSSNSDSRSSQQKQHDQQQRLQQLYPPWNPSNKIGRDGFLQDLYRRIPGEWEKEIRFNTMYRLNDDDDPHVPSATTTSSHAKKKKNSNNNNKNSGGSSAYCQIRQVPGDGNCLFHSISLCLHHATNDGTHWNMMMGNKKSSLAAAAASSSSSSSSSSLGLEDLYQRSQKLRQDAVACLRQAHRRLVLQGPERLACRELVQAAAQQYGLTSAEYCQCMSQDSVWGGGPEIVALCNVLQRPIHVYELATVLEQQQQQQQQPENNNNHKNKRKPTNSILASSTTATTDDCSTNSILYSSSSSSSSVSPCFVLRRMACFGSPRFDRRQPLHILSADSRFPDLEPGQQLAAGNHFLAVFPVTDNDDNDNDGSNRRKRRKKRGIRGGGRIKKQKNDDMDDDDDDDDDVYVDDEDLDCQNSRGPWRWLNLWRRLL